MQRSARRAHLITAHARAADGRAPARARGRGDRRRRATATAASLFYDLAKASAIRLAEAQAAELEPHGVAAVAVTPGFLRSEAMLDHFGVTAATWRDAIAKDPHFAQSETPRFVGRGDRRARRRPGLTRAGPAARSARGTSPATYGFEDVDGARPDWGAYAATL